MFAVLLSKFQKIPSTKINVPVAQNCKEKITIKFENFSRGTIYLTRSPVANAIVVEFRQKLLKNCSDIFNP